MLSQISNEIRSHHYGSNDIEEAANKISKHYSKDDQIPIVKIVDNLGFKVFLQDLPTSLNGYILISGEYVEKLGSDRIMVLNTNNSAKRRRFTLAHELGHYLIDEEAKKVCEYYKACENDNDTSETEQLVGHFAAALLMPDEKFKEVYNKYIDENKSAQYIDIIKWLSDIFNVPYKAVEKRFGELGIEVFKENSSSQKN